MEILYPIFYGTRLVTMDVLRETFEPGMHPEAARRGFAFIESRGGLFGIGGGIRAPGAQPVKPGFAPEGKTFHQKQRFPSGQFYAAWDMVCVSYGGVHRAPQWSEVPAQGGRFSVEFGWHMNVSSEAWHAQPIELDGWLSWVNRNRPDLQADYHIIGSVPLPPVVQPPTPDPGTQPPSQGVEVQFTSRVLQEGAVGNDVKFFQRILNDVSGAGLLLDGHYGTRTRQAVTSWQSYFNGLGDTLDVDGVLGPRTQGHMVGIALQV